MKLQITTDIADIVAITQRSAGAKDGICIMELATMDRLMPMVDAEAIRAKMLANKVTVRQLTNLWRFKPWTKVKGFVEACMEVRHIDMATIAIETEVLIFDDIVALYRTQPEVCVAVIQDPAFAAQQKAVFDAIWQVSHPLTVTPDGSTVT